MDQYITTLAPFQPGLLVEELAVEGGSLWFAHVHITTLAPFQPGLLMEELAVKGGSLWFGHVHITTLAPFKPGLLVEELRGNNILMIPQSLLDSSTASNTNGPFQADITPLYFSNFYGCQQCGYIHIPCNGHLTDKPCLLSIYIC